MFGTEAQTELGDLKVVATKSGGRMKYIDRSADWHEADMPTVFRNVRYQGQSGKHVLALSFSGFDPGCAKTFFLPQKLHATGTIRIDTTV